MNDETQMIDLVPYLEGKMTETKRWLGGGFGLWGCFARVRDYGLLLQPSLESDIKTVAVLDLIEFR